MLAVLRPSDAVEMDGGTTSAPSDELARRLEQARALQAKGSSPEARKLYESLLPALEAQKRRGELAAALTALTEIASAQGDYDVAVARARESVELYRSLGDAVGQARALNNWGANELYRGDYPAALTQFQQALALYRTTANGDGEVEQLTNIGTVSYFQGKYLEAWRAYREAMNRVEQASAEPWSARLRQLVMHNLATLFQRVGRDDRALELYQGLRKSPRALRPSEEARLLVNVGVLYRRLGDPVKAVETYRKAQELFARDQHLHGQIGALRNIGIALALDLGDLSGALEAFDRALALAVQSGDRLQETHAHLYRGQLFLRLNQLQGAKTDFEAALASAKERGTPEEEWKARFGLGRLAQRLGNEELARDQLRQAIAVIETTRSKLQLAALRAEFLGDKRDVYDALIELSLSKADATELFGLMERSRARVFQDQLDPIIGPGRTAPDGSVSLADVQARLDDSTLLLEFWATPTRIAAIWVTRDASGIVPGRLSPEERQRLSSFSQNVDTGSDEGWQSDSRALGGILLSAIEPLGRSQLRHLLVVPDGILQSVPFELLRTGGGKQPLLVERFDVSYLPSAAVLLRSARPGGSSWNWPWQRRMVAFGDPIVRNRPSEILPAGDTRARLPKSGEEVQAIARMTPGRAQMYLGAADLKQHLLQGVARGVPLLHLSTHATADDDNPERSRILFSPATDAEAADYLFLKEIYTLDLRGVQLTTLSACDTERGKLVKGEGIQGFSRALLSAGSQTAVTSLWRVEDQATAELMKQFYFELSRGTPKAEALRLAKLKFLRSGTALAEPRHWAAFVLNGDGREPLSRVISWATLLAPLAGALLLAGLLARRWL